MRCAAMLLAAAFAASSCSAESDKTPGTVTPGGSELIQDQVAPKSAAVVEVEGVYFEDIEAHVKATFGSYDQVIHELVSEYVHVDVLPVPPSQDWPFWTLITVGMSDRPMTMPASLENSGDWDRAELMMLLPPDWAANVDELMSEQKFEPVAVLRSMARYPHQALTFFAPGHTIPVLWDKIAGTEFNSIMFHWPHSLDDQQILIQAKDGEVINLYAVYALYPDELEAKLQIGSAEVHEAFRIAGFGDQFLPGRNSLVVNGKLLGQF